MTDEQKEQLDAMLEGLDEWHSAWLDSMSPLERGAYAFDECIKQQHHADLLRRAHAANRHRWVRQGWKR